MADAEFSITEGGVFIPEIWSPQLLAAMQANLVMANLTVDRTSELSPSGNKLDIPSFSGISALEKAAKTPTVLQQPSTDSLSLSIDSHWYVDIAVEDSLSAVSKYNLVNEFITNGGYQVAKKFDTSMLALYSGLTNTVAMESDTSDTTVYGHMLDALEYLNVNDVPETERYFVVHPKMLTRLLGIDKLLSALYNGGGAAAINGKVSQILGATIYVSSNVPKVQIGTGTTYTYHNMFFNKNAFCYAVKLGPRTQFEYSLRDRAMTAGCDMFWGVLTQRPLFGVDVTIIA